MISIKHPPSTHWDKEKKIGYVPTTWENLYLANGITTSWTWWYYNSSILPHLFLKPRHCNHEFRQFLSLIFWSLLTRRNQFVHILTDFYRARYMRELSAGAAAWILELNMVDIKCGFRNLHNSIFPYISLSPSSTPTKSTKLWCKF